MATAPPASIVVVPTAAGNGTVVGQPKELDAGALFVLKSQGSWLHCGYHMTSAIVAPALLSLPFAFSLMGWAGGVICLTAGGLVTFYTYNLLSIVLEHHAQLGKRQLRFRDMANDILGPGWGRYFVGPLQATICYGCVIANILLGGQSLKFIYLVSTPNGSMELYHFIVIFGGLTLVMAQLPSFHSLRHINLASLILCLAYCALTTGGSIYIGHSKGLEKDYSITKVGINRSFGVFNAISIIATTYGNGIIPEIQVFYVNFLFNLFNQFFLSDLLGIIKGFEVLQATIAPPVTGKMFKGLLVCYSVVISTFFSVAISGYWAFGNHSQGSVLQNFIVDGKPLLPKWILLITNVFTLLQVSACTLTYMQPANVILEKTFANPKKGEFSIRNVVPRLVSRSVAVVAATVMAAMLPFFGDIMAIFGAFGFIPLDFILPVVFYNVTFKPSKMSLKFWGNTTIIVASTALSLIGAVTSVRQMVLDAKTYRLFANL